MCEPIRGAEGVPTSAAHQGTPSNISPGEGREFPDSYVGERPKSNCRTVWRVPIGSDWRVAPSAAKPNVHTNATPPSSEWATGNPTGDPEITISGLIWPIYGGGGNPIRAAVGQGSQPEVPEKGHPVRKPGYPTCRTEKRVVPSGLDEHPPVDHSQCPGNNRDPQLQQFLLNTWTTSSVKLMPEVVAIPLCGRIVRWKVPFKVRESRVLEVTFRTTTHERALPCMQSDGEFIETL